MAERANDMAGKATLSSVPNGICLITGPLANAFCFSDDEHQHDVLKKHLAVTTPGIKPSRSCHQLGISLKNCASYHVESAHCPSPAVTVDSKVKKSLPLGIGTFI